MGERVLVPPIVLRATTIQIAHRYPIRCGRRSGARYEWRSRQPLVRRRGEVNICLDVSADAIAA